MTTMCNLKQYSWSRQTMTLNKGVLAKIALAHALKLNSDRIANQLKKYKLSLVEPRIGAGSNILSLSLGTS